MCTVYSIVLSRTLDGKCTTFGAKVDALWLNADFVQWRCPYWTLKGTYPASL